ncbi:MAG: putative toxin-antitoxin system toxin component, PIN family [Candidatus Krumholzibacteriia bacterium]
MILDRNVLMSGIFFDGPPHLIFDAWRSERLALVLTPEIFEEYWLVGLRLNEKYPGVEVNPILALIATNGELVSVPALAARVCEDPTDDKFLACAIGAKVQTIGSGDRHLLQVDRFQGVRVLTPRQFVEDYLE